MVDKNPKLGVTINFPRPYGRGFKYGSLKDAAIIANWGVTQ